MFRLVFENKILGVTKLESGDPSIGNVSGELVQAGSCTDMREFILKHGGAEEEGVSVLDIDSQFLVLVGDAIPVPFHKGSIICVPAENEIFLDLEGIDQPEYGYFFPNHVAQFQQEQE